MARRSASDIGIAIDGPENNKIAAWAFAGAANTADHTITNGRSIVLAITKQPGANVIDTVGRIKAAMPRLRAPFRQPSTSIPDRPHPDHPRLGRGCGVHPGADHRAGGDGDLRVPAQRGRHADPVVTVPLASWARPR
jgi:hypothetical protein